MRYLSIFIGLLLLFLISGCKKSAELDTDYIPVFNANVEAKVTITNLLLKATFTGITIAKAEKCGFELIEKDGTTTKSYTIAKPGLTEMVLQIDSAFRESIVFKARAWIKVGKKKFYSGYAYFTGLGFPPPEIISVSKNYAIRFEVFYINGKYFTDSYANNRIVVKIDNIPGVVVSANFNKIGVQMPVTTTRGRVKIVVSAFGKNAVEKFEIENYLPEIYSLTPEAISPTDEITIKGKFRSEYKDVIYPIQNDFGRYKIMKYTDDEIIIRPGDYMNCDSAYCIYFSLTNPYSIDYFNSGYSVKRKGNWKGLNKTPFELGADFRYYGLACNGKGYVMAFNMRNNQNLFWRYDPQSDSWTKLPQFPGDYRIAPVFTDCNGLIYCGLGFDYYSYKRSDFYKFDPTNDAWSSCAEFNFDNINGPSVFSRTIQDAIYVFSDSQKKKALYDPVSNKWEVSACDVPHSSFTMAFFANKGKYYLQSDWQFYQCDPATNNFTLQYSTYDISYFATAFTAGDRIFMYGSCRIWEIDLTNKRADMHNELSNYYSKDSYGSVKLFDINDESYFLTQPRIFSKFNLAK